MTPNWLTNLIQLPDEATRLKALERQQQLTKPAGSLGKLEQLAVDLAAMQGEERPRLDGVQISIFAADHGVAEEGVSAFPQQVTAQMIANFAAGGAAICTLANQIGAHFEVVNLGTVVPVAPSSAVVDALIAPMTNNFSHQSAMSDEHLALALDAGRSAVQRAHARGSRLFIGGEMGIANTTSASALSSALTTATVSELTGRGTGIEEEKIQHKIAVIENALAFHAGHLDSPVEVLRRLGGYEIAGLVGAYIRAAQLGMTVLVDGFITTAAALVALRINPAVKNWLIFSHCSAESGHKRLLEEIGADPLLALEMRLGEASGAVLAVPLLRSACVLHNGMATFAEAAVAEKAEGCGE